MSNLALWKQVEKTNPAHTKKVEFGRKFTAIDAHSQIMAATEAFGPCGIGWGVSDSKYTLIVVDANDPHYNLISYTALLWFKQGGETGSFDISADIELFEYSNKHSKWSRVEDTHKKVKTDALTKGLSWLGFNADVFLGKFDNNKYVRDVAQEFSEPRPQAKPEPQQPPKREPVESEQSDFEKALERLKSAAKNVGMDPQNLADYLKKYYNITWKGLNESTANKVASAIENSTVITA